VPDRRSPGLLVRLLRHRGGAITSFAGTHPALASFVDFPGFGEAAQGAAGKTMQVLFRADPIPATHKHRRTPHLAQRLAMRRLRRLGRAEFSLTNVLLILVLGVLLAGRDVALAACDEFGVLAVVRSQGRSPQFGSGAGDRLEFLPQAVSARSRRDRRQAPRPAQAGGRGRGDGDRRAAGLHHGPAPPHDPARDYVRREIVREGIWREISKFEEKAALFEEQLHAVFRRTVSSSSSARCSSSGFARSARPSLDYATAAASPASCRRKRQRSAVATACVLRGSASRSTSG